MSEEFGWSEVDYATIVKWFSFAYACGYLLMGRVSDLIGALKGYAFSIGGWSLATMSHAFVQTVGWFSFARAALGITEGGNFPVAIKVVAEWFPKNERAFATGIFNAGTNVGALLAPILVPLITVAWGWEWAFILTGVVGFLWLVASLRPRISGGRRTCSPPPATCFRAAPRHLLSPSYGPFTRHSCFPTSSCPVATLACSSTAT